MSKNLLWITIFVCPLLLILFRKKSIDIAYLLSVDWDFSMESERDLVDRTREIILTTEKLSVKYQFNDISESIYISSKERCGAISVFFDQSGKVTGAWVCGLKYKSKTNSWAYDLRNTIQKIIMENQPLGVRE